MDRNYKLEGYMHTRSASFAHYLFNILNFLATLLLDQKKSLKCRGSLTFVFTYNRPLDKAFRAALGSILPKQQLYDPARRRLRGLSKLSTGVPSPRCVSGGRRSSRFLSVSCSTEAHAYITPAGPPPPPPLVTHVIVMLWYLAEINAFGYDSGDREEELKQVRQV